MALDQVKILGTKPSPFVARAVIALNIKGVQYELIEENLLSAKSDLLLQSNPAHKKVPVLCHGERVLCESIVIVQYIDEFWASSPSILPADPYDRDTARFWSAYIDNKLFSALKEIIMAEEETKKTAAITEATQVMALLEDVLKKQSDGQRFFGGDRIGFLDISLGCSLGCIRLIQIMADVSLIDESKNPNLFQWAQDFWSDAAVKEVLPTPDELHGFAEVFVEKVRFFRNRKNVRA